LIIIVANTIASRKAKGRRLQEKVRTDLVKSLGIDPQDIQSRGMSQPGTDIILSPAARDKMPFSIECKNQESLNVWQSMQQAEANAAKDGLKPLLIFKRNKSDAYCVLKWADLLALLQKGI
jgi:hypothetical protein